MKRLYSLLSVTLSTFLYPMEHSQAIERRGSLTSLFKHASSSEIETPKRRNSIIDYIRGKSNSSPQLPINAKFEKKTRERTHSAGDVTYPSSKLNKSFSSSLQDLELKPAPPLPIWEDDIESKFKQAQYYLEQARTEKDPDKRKKNKVHAEVLLEVLRLANHEPSIRLLLTEVYAKDFDTRSTAQLTDLELSILSLCKKDPDLITYFNQLRVQMLEENINHHYIEGFAKVLLSFVGVRKKVDVQETKKLIERMIELKRRREFLEGVEFEFDEHGNPVLLSGSELLPRAG